MGHLLRVIKMTNTTPLTAQKGKVRKMEKAEVEVMESDDYVTWKPATVIKNLWQCAECGLVWQMRHQAQNCKSRNHVQTFKKKYKDGREFAFSAVRKERAN